MFVGVKFHVDLFGKLLGRLEAHIPFFIRMDVRIEEVAHGLDALFPQFLDGIARARTAAHMKQ